MRDCDRATQLSHSQTSILKTSRIKDPRWKKDLWCCKLAAIRATNRLYFACDVAMLISCQPSKRTVCMHAKSLQSSEYSHANLDFHRLLKNWKRVHSYRSGTGQTERSCHFKEGIGVSCISTCTNPSCTFPHSYHLLNYLLALLIFYGPWLRDQKTLSVVL